MNAIVLLVLYYPMVRISTAQYLSLFCDSFTAGTEFTARTEDPLPPDLINLGSEFRESN